jgi:hypothetical protein
MIEMNPAALERRPLRRAEASEYLENRYGIRRTVSTLAKLAVIGGGPLFRRAGRTPLYAPDDLDRWAAEKLGPPQRTTSDVMRCP